MRGRDETEEGIDRKLALHYYARWRFTYESVQPLFPLVSITQRRSHSLLPLLEKAAAADEDAKIMTVLSGQIDGSVDLSDLGLKNTFSLGNAAKAASAYNNLMIQVSCTIVE